MGSPVVAVLVVFALVGTATGILEGWHLWAVVGGIAVALLFGD